jgi:hypothetical protein
MWRNSPRGLRVVASLGFGAAIALMGLYFLPVTRPQPWSVELLIPPGALVVLSLCLVLIRYRPNRPPESSGPRREANEAVMPIPGEAPRAAIGGDRS